MTSIASTKLPISEKIGYSLGDAAANFVWRSGFLIPIFYTDTFGLAAAQVAILLLIVRLSDGVTDIVMGSIADRTRSKAGKYRSWILWSTPALGLFLALQFTTPDLSDSGKLIYAYVVYFGVVLAYTANNVPYGALMGVMTSSASERSSLASFRFIGAFGGGLLVMTLMPILVKYFGNGNDAQGYQYTMIIFALLLVCFMMVTYFTTQERIKIAEQNHGSFGQEMKELFSTLPVILIPVLGVSSFFISLAKIDWPSEYKYFAGAFMILSFIVTIGMRMRLISKPDSEKTNAQRDLSDLLTNTPWLILLGIGIAFGLFTVVRPSAAGYYFKYFLGREDLISLYFFITVSASLIAAVCTNYLFKIFSKRVLMGSAFLLGAVFHMAIYFIEPEQAVLMLSLAAIGEFFAGMLPIVFFSMLGDTVDYSEWKNGRRATGLIYSAGTFINKTGHGFAGALVVLVLALVGYDAEVESSIAGAIPAMVMLMTTIPVAIAIVGALLVYCYPLSDKKVYEIEKELLHRRGEADAEQESEMQSGETSLA